MIRLAILLALLAGAAAAQGFAPCRQALALGVDISGSVNKKEHDLQRNGLALALLDPSVQSAFLAQPDKPVRLFIFEWAGPRNQAVIVPWREIRSVADLQVVAGILYEAERKKAGSRTATGRAMLFGAEALRTQTDCERWTMDISTDGLSNSADDPRDVREMDELANITVNGLAIGSGGLDGRRPSLKKLARLTEYLIIDVVRGPDAFVEVAETFRDFGPVMRRKLLKELGTRAFGALEGGDDGSNG